MWRQRFLSLRLPGLEKDAPRPGRIPRISHRKVSAVVRATLHTIPPNATDWSTRTMAKAQGLSEATIRRIWQQHNSPTWSRRSSSVGTNTSWRNATPWLAFISIAPRQGPGVLRGRKEPDPGAGAIKPLLPLCPGISARQAHDCKRHGTTTLFAALSLLDGKIIGDCIPRHRHRALIRFLQIVNVKTPPDLDLHLIADNYGTRKHPRVQSW